MVISAVFGLWGGLSLFLQFPRPILPFLFSFFFFINKFFYMFFPSLTLIIIKKKTSGPIYSKTDSDLLVFFSPPLLELFTLPKIWSSTFRIPGHLLNCYHAFSYGMWDHDMPSNLPSSFVYTSLLLFFNLLTVLNRLINVSFPTENGYFHLERKIL